MANEPRSVDQKTVTKSPAKNRFFNGSFGFASVDGVSDDIFYHRSALPTDEKGRVIQPVNEGGRMEITYGKLADDKSKFAAVAIHNVIDVFVPEKKKSA